MHGGDAGIIRRIKPRRQCGVIARPVADRQIEARIKQGRVQPAIHQVEQGCVDGLRRGLAAGLYLAGVAGLPCLNHGVVQRA